MDLAQPSPGEAGRANYFEVLEAEQQLFPAQYALARAQRDQLVTVVTLYKATWAAAGSLAPEQWNRQGG